MYPGNRNNIKNKYCVSQNYVLFQRIEVEKILGLYCRPYTVFFIINLPF